jgi:uncharacterized repeat protein (TIGR03803 family)
MAKNRVLLATIIVAAFGAAALNTKAQVLFTNLHSFSASVSNTNSDGANSYSGVTISGSAMYGTATYGGKGSGTIFSLKTDGSGFSNLYSFSPRSYNSSLGIQTNAEGAYPVGQLALSGTNLYGIAQYGGTNGEGVIFRIGTNGLGYAQLHVFSILVFNGGSLETNGDGISPAAGLALSNNALYGAAPEGGSGGTGTIFSLDGTTGAFTNLHNFSPTALNPTTAFATNSDGNFPSGGLLLQNGVLFGTAQAGGTGGTGTIFRMDVNGQHFTNLHNFATAKYNSVAGAFTNQDGVYPKATLVSDGQSLYGTTYYGETTGYGTVFKIGLDGSGFTNLYTFTYGSDGANLQSGLILSNNVLFGTAVNGGANGSGTVFRLNTDGTGFATVHAFTSLSSGSSGTNYDGASPAAPLTLVGGSLFGTAPIGGLGGTGTIFELSAAAPPAPGPTYLTIGFSGNNAILSWTNAAYSLQSADAVTGPYDVVPRATSPFTNATAGATKFFRLAAP